jgi:hypothetical protein
MSESTDYPAFEDALKRFVAFARENGAPQHVLFVRPNDVALYGGRLCVPSLNEGAARRRAESTYQSAVERGRGVLISGLCRLADTTCAFVYGPQTSEEAASLLYPSGLKLSVAQPLRDAHHASPWGFWIARLQEALSGRGKMKRELFK